jgi:predicted RNA binding protein YcfA (HicA-like mRNA interferase family)
LDIATQGKTEKEVKENMAELIGEYLRDPDTPKPSLDDLMSFSLTSIPLKFLRALCMAKLRPLAQRRVIEILRSNGFQEVRSGRHIAFKKKVGQHILTTWTPHHKRSYCFCDPIHY